MSALFGVNFVTASTCNNQTFLVIGAGISGLAAANHLKEQGCEVTVIEARDRIGGRINTDVMGSTGGGIKVDMGASWIHGIGPGAGDLDRFEGKMNPIYKIARDNQINTVATWVDEDDTVEKSYWWKSDTTPLTQSRLTNMADAIEEHVEEKKDSATQSQSIAQSLADFNYGGTADDLLVFKAVTNRLLG